MVTTFREPRAVGRLGTSARMRVSPNVSRRLFRFRLRLLIGFLLFLLHYLCIPEKKTIHVGMYYLNRCRRCSSLPLTKAVHDVTSVCEQQRRGRRPSCPCTAHFASWRASVGQVHAGFLLQKKRSHPPSKN